MTKAGKPAPKPQAKTKATKINAAAEVPPPTRVAAAIKDSGMGAAPRAIKDSGL